MIRNIAAPRASRFLALLLPTLACLALSALLPGGASAFTQEITDIEDPAVKAKVLDLEVEATRTIHVENIGSYWFATTDWDHSLSGELDDSLTEAQLPKVTIQRNPTVVSLAGELKTVRAEGTVVFKDLECQFGRLTTESPLLDVSLEGFYESATPSPTGLAEVSLTTQNIDEWGGSCSSWGGPPDQTTNIATFATPTTTYLDYATSSGAGAIGPTWKPVEGGFTTTKDVCTAEFCDFTITGTNENTARPDYMGTANSSFTLKLRLEYPKDVVPGPTPIAAPDTLITQGPKKLIRTKNGKKQVLFKFRSTGLAGTTFECRLDKAPFAPCSSPFKRKVGPGKHRFAVVSATQGTADPSPAVHRFTVKKTKKKLKR